jgi:hypothetical protein
MEGCVRVAMNLSLVYYLDIVIEDTWARGGLTRSNRDGNCKHMCLLDNAKAII